MKLLKPNDVVFDVFAGIGPFAVPAAKKNARVYANDLNPHSYEFLVKNTVLNKCKQESVKCYNQDGREFIQTVIKQELEKLYSSWDEKTKVNVCVIMNLPALAYTFLDAFHGLLSESAVTIPEAAPKPQVYCYCFTDNEAAQASCGGDMELEVKQRAAGVLRGLVAEEVTVRQVRNVAPKKDMMCLSFALTRDILQPAASRDEGDGNLACIDVLKPLTLLHF